MDAYRSYIEARQKRLRQEREELDQAAQQARELAQASNRGGIQ